MEGTDKTRSPRYGKERQQYHGESVSEAGIAKPDPETGVFPDSPLSAPASAIRDE
jgi:hypothetical protein